MKIGFKGSIPKVIKRVEDSSPKLDKEISKVVSNVADTETRSTGIFGAIKNIFQKKKPVQIEEVKYADDFIKKTPADLLIDLKKDINELGSASLAEKTNLDNMYTIKMMIDHKLPVSEIDEVAKLLNRDNKHLVEGMFRALENNPSGVEKVTGELNSDKIKDIMSVHNDQNFGSILKLLNARDANQKTLFSYDDVVKIAKEVDTFPKMTMLNHILPKNGGDGSHLEVDKIVDELKNY